MSADPYEVLGLDGGSDDAEIRRRYLELVRQHPPDRDPQQFAAVREAYEQLRDPEVRLRSKLFSLDTNQTIDAVLADVKQRLGTVRIRPETLLSLAEE